MIDPEAGTITISMTLAMWGSALAMFGLMMAGIAFVVATYSLFQRHNMHSETMHYVRLLTQANNYAEMLEAQKPVETVVRVDGASLTNLNEEVIRRMVDDTLAMSAQMDNKKDPETSERLAEIKR